MIFLSDINKNLIRLLILLNLLVTIRSQEKTEQDNTEHLKDRSFFKGFALQKQFLIADNNKDRTATQHFYMFGMHSKENVNEETDEMVTNEFYFDMYKYKNDYPKTTIGHTLDLTDMEFEKERNVIIKDTLLQPIKLKNNFYKAEMKISQNDCLTLFLFLDSEENTKLEVFESRHDVYFDFRANKKNQFLSAFNTYWGHTKESYDLIYNDFPKEYENVYLKIVCPYYSYYGENTINFDLTLYHEFYNFNCNFCFSELIVS